MAKPVRTFVALGLPEQVCQRLLAFQQRLKGTVEGVRWGSRGSLHLTMKFLGNVENERIYSICRRITVAAQGHAPIPLQVKGIGAFPNPERPRVLWAGIGGEIQRLQQLHAALDEALDPEGFGREDRQFRPHITIGRARGRLESVQHLIERHGSLEFGSTTATEVLVMASDLTPKGPVYSVMGRASLAGK